MPDWVDAVILGIIEGLTEFIPVSSTGHLIVAGELLDFEGPAAGTFEIFIQLGAILAICVLYRHRLRLLASVDDRPGFAGRRGWLILGLATAPAGLTGLLAYDLIRDHLFSSFTVAVGWAIGGVALLVVERALPHPEATREARLATAGGTPDAGARLPRVPGRVTSASRAPEPTYETLDDITWKVALAIGLCQCLALWPGMSRSASTIVGAMFLGVSRKAAAEFSFFAAIPLIAGAAAYDLWSNRASLSADDIPIFAIGFTVAFVSALLAVRWFVALLGSRTMVPFGWYRIAAAGVLFLMLL